MKRIKGLDSLRFIAALIVLISHVGMPVPDFMNVNMGANAWLVNIGKVLGLVFNGPAAVICFFIISGFCINYPYKEAAKINLLSYYTRRLLRIGIPALIALFLYIVVDADFINKNPQLGVLWSVICEIVYYILFPFFFYIRKKIRWEYIFVFAYVFSFIVLLFNFELYQKVNHAYSPSIYLGWLIGLPCWLLGCWLSENFNRFQLLSNLKLWGVRFLIIFVVTFLHIIKFHVNSPFVSYSFTLNLFSILACVWIGFEIVYFLNNDPNHYLELGGKWSYSLYLVHPILIELLIFYKTNNSGKLMIMFLALVFSYIFYLMIEKTSHRFSIFISKKYQS